MNVTYSIIYVYFIDLRLFMLFLPDLPYTVYNVSVVCYEADVLSVNYFYCVPLGPL